MILKVKPYKGMYICIYAPICNWFNMNLIVDITFDSYMNNTDILSQMFSHRCSQAEV